MPSYATSTASVRRPTRSRTVVRLAQIRNSASGSSELARPPRRPRAAARRAGRVAAPGRGRPPSVVVAWISWARADRVAGTGDPDRVAGEPLASEKMPSSILSWASAGQDRRALGRRLARDELDRPPRREHRPGRVAGRPPDGPAARGGARARPGRAGRRAADGRLEVGRRPRTSARPRTPPPRPGPGGRPGRSAARPAAVRAGPPSRPAPATRASASSSAASSSAAACRRRRTRRRRSPRPAPGRVVGRQPVLTATAAGGPSRPPASAAWCLSADGQEVGCDRPADRSWRNAIASPASTMNPFASASPAGPQVGVERRRRRAAGR